MRLDGRRDHEKFRELGGSMESYIVKRSIVIAGHKTSVSLEDAFWSGLKEIASGRDQTLSEMVSAIDSGRAQGNLSSAIRLFVLDHYRNLIEGTSPVGIRVGESEQFRPELGIAKAV
jgi:predicted DNA-binding ribbon-helix-helix protein